MTGSLLYYTVAAIDLMNRIVALSFALSLVLRAVLERWAPRAFRNPYFRVLAATDVVVAPVRSLLPTVLTMKRMDYSPLVSAILILLVSLGIDRLLIVVTTGG